MAVTPRRLFVAGSSGATGQVLVPLALRQGLDVVPHLRPARAAEGKVPPNAAVVDLAETKALAVAMKGCTTVVQLIGTMRNRFAKGDTYESSDIGTTAQLIAAAKDAGVDHLVVLTSVGAGRPMGAYLQAKAKVEALTRESGIAWTVFRPSALVGGERKKIPLVKGLTHALGLTSYEPISLEELSAAMLQCAVDHAPLNVALQGDALWELVAKGRQRFLKA